MSGVPNEEIRALEGIFEAEIEAASFVMEGEVGLSVLFAQESCVDAIFIDERHKKALIAKTHALSFLSLCRAFSRKAVGQFDMVNRGRTLDNCLMQDPFHRDEFSFGARHVSMLCKPFVGASRSTPTCYAKTSAVRSAIQNLAVPEGLPVHVTVAVDKMRENSYGFSLTSGVDALPRNTLRTAYPDFMSHVLALIPEGKKYAQTWGASDNTLVVHSNLPEDIVHGRPKGGEFAKEVDVLVACDIRL